MPSSRIHTVVGDVLQPAVPVSKSDDAVTIASTSARERARRSPRSGAPRPAAARPTAATASGSQSRIERCIVRRSGSGSRGRRATTPSRAARRSAQEAGLGRAHRGRARRARCRVVPPTSVAVDEDALERLLAAARRTTRTGRTTSEVDQLVEVPLVDEQLVQAAEARAATRALVPGPAHPDRGRRARCRRGASTAPRTRPSTSSESFVGVGVRRRVGERRLEERRRATSSCCGI